MKIKTNTVSDNNNHFLFAASGGEQTTNKLEFSNLKAFALLGLSALFYVAYLATCGIFHNIDASTDLKAISPWLVRCALENDGIELYVMTLAMPLFLFGAYLISISKRLNSPLLQKPWVLWFYLLIPIMAFALQLVRREPLYFRSFVLFLFATFFAYSFYYLAKINVSKWVRLVNGGFFLFLIFYGFVINDNADIYNYGYLIGPANKLLQGETLGSFYIQYNFLITSITMIMLKMHFLVHQMQVVMIVIFALWIMLYKNLASNIFQNKIIVFYFIAALLIVRGIAILGGPISAPQVSPLRLDLWVPILLVVLYWGYESMVTSICFSMMYLFDDVFGFFYLCLYLFSIVIIYYNKYSQTGENPLSTKTLKYFVPALIAALIHFAIFKTLTSPAGKIYSDYHLGFLPIARSSSFWLMVWMLPVCLYFLIQDKKNKGLILFIFGLVCIQLTYFFGRSHENNLLNISGIFIFILFLAIDRLYSHVTKKQIGILLISLLIGFIVLNYNQSIWEAKLNLKNKIENGIVYEDPMESQIRSDGEYLKTLHTEKIILITEFDSYINYRLGYKQVGFFSPFYANIENAETVNFLYKQLKKGYRLIAYPGLIIPACFKPYNIELAKITKTETFTLDYLQNNLMELKLVPCK